ncbi:MAG: hypothetical protein IJX34_01955 [Clostridia bacterium]|nr:hypothetical protein [Clostridia bacterium]
MKKRNKNKNSSVFLKEAETTLEQDIEQGIDIVNRNREELNSERNQRINKFERNASGQLIERPKIRYRISTKTIVFIVCFILLITWLLNDYGPIFGIHINNRVSTSLEENKIELVTKDSDIYGMYNEELFVYSNNTITTYNNKNEITWTHVFSDSFSPNIYVEGKYMLVTNNSTGTVYLFENSKEVLNKKIDGTIKNAFLDKYGNMALEYSNESGFNNVISVFDKRGRNKFDAYLTQENIISMKMLNNAEKIIFTEAVTNSSNIGVKFRMIDISKSEEEQIKDIVALDNQFVYDFNIQGKNIYALLDNKIIQIDIDTGNVTPLKEFNNTQLIFVALNKNYYTYLERNLQENKYVIENMNYNGTKISTTSIESLPKSMITSDFVNYYIYPNHVFILNKWGIELKSHETNFTPKQCVVFNNNKSLALIYTNKIYVINL